MLMWIAVELKPSPQWYSRNSYGKCPSLDNFLPGQPSKEQARILPSLRLPQVFCKQEIQVSVTEARENPDSPPIHHIPDVLLFLWRADWGQVGGITQPHLAPPGWNGISTPECGELTGHRSSGLQNRNKLNPWASALCDNTFGRQPGTSMLLRNVFPFISQGP